VSDKESVSGLQEKLEEDLDGVDAVMGVNVITCDCPANRISVMVRWHRRLRQAKLFATFLHCAGNFCDDLAPVQNVAFASVNNDRVVSGARVVSPTETRC